MKLKNYTLKYFIIALLAVIALWASLFYMLIIEEVYDNIDDGLKNSKLLIIREAQHDKKILNTPRFGINQYKIVPLKKGGSYDFSDHFTDTFEYMEYDEDDEPVRLLQTVFNDAEGNPYHLTIRASMVEEDELMEDIMTALIALYIMLVVSIALINHVILKKAWKSFYNLLSQLKDYRLGTGETFNAPGSPIHEFKILGAELENALKRNEEVYSSQKEFIENASHELQTPLAISLNKLELFAGKHNLDEEQMTDIATINDTLHRLVRLNKSLLMLSKIENRQFFEEETVDINEVTQQVINELEDIAVYKNVSITYEHIGALNFNMNKGLAVILISNLIKNATLHNIPGGTVNVTTENNALSVTNTTAGTALDHKAIFERFYKKSDSNLSTGLGLSIIKSITTVYNLQLTYDFNGSHIFSIKFPQ